jgi:hypothetical protein
MNKQIQRIHVIAAILILSTTVIGGQVAYAASYFTNEGSYKYGYQAGQGEWWSCTSTDGEGDCTAAHDYCSNPIIGDVYNATIGEHVQVGLGHVGNLTACVDGYTHAWNHFCDPLKAKKADTMSCPLTSLCYKYCNIVTGSGSRFICLLHLISCKTYFSSGSNICQISSTMSCHFVMII